MRTVLSSALILALAACAASPAYSPANSNSDYGYRDQQIENDRFRVSYRGKSGLEADDGALRRAAEITIAERGTWFRVVSRSSDTVGRSSRGPSIGIGGSTGGRNSSVGVGVQLPLGGGQSPDVEVRLEIQIGQGEQPNSPDVYDARSLLRNL